MQNKEKLDLKNKKNAVNEEASVNKKNVEENKNDLKKETSEKLNDISSGIKKISQGCSVGKDFFDKKFIVVCSLSAIISIISAFGIVKMGLSYSNEKIQELSNNYTSLDNKIKIINEMVSSLDSSVASIKDDMKLGKENSTYIYSSIASLQKDIGAIKKEFHLKDVEEPNDEMKKLPSEKFSFIESLSNLVKEGAPFNSFIESYSDKIDFKKYATAENLLKFSGYNVKSIDVLKKDFGAVGLAAFEVVLNESFWEKQKRVIKEKIVDAIKIKKTDEKAETIDEELNDKALFSKASQFISEGNTEDAIKALEKIKSNGGEIDALIKDVKARSDLNNSFNSFKKEFVNLETKN